MPTHSSLTRNEQRAPIAAALIVHESGSWPLEWHWQLSCARVRSALRCAALHSAALHCTDRKLEVAVTLNHCADVRFSSVQFNNEQRAHTERYPYCTVLRTAPQRTVQCTWRALVRSRGGISAAAGLDERRGEARRGAAGGHRLVAKLYSTRAARPPPGRLPTVPPGRPAKAKRRCFAPSLRFAPSLHTNYSNYRAPPCAARTCNCRAKRFRLRVRTARMSQTVSTALLASSSLFL